MVRKVVKLSTSFKPGNGGARVEIENYLILKHTEQNLS